MVAFSITGIFGRIGIEPESGRIVEISAPGRSTQVNFVKQTLAQFTNCVKIVIERFPFYSIECDPVASGAVAEGIRRALAEIDDEAMMFNGFWESFTDDVAIGDFATELVP